MARLDQAVSYLKNHHYRDGVCLQATRDALKSIGLTLPAPCPPPNNTALHNYKLLSKNPAKFGWKKASSYNETCLVYFDDCGKLADGRTAGHIGLLSKGVIYSNRAYTFSPEWSKRVIGIYVPV